MIFNRVVYKILIIFLIIVVYLIYHYFSCIVLKFSEIPQEIKVNMNKNTKYICFLYGYICGECDDESYLYSLRNRKDIVFVVPTNFKSLDIENLKQTFSFKGKFVKGNEKIESFLNLFVKCLRANSNKINLIIDAKNKKIIRKPLNKGV